MKNKMKNKMFDIIKYIDIWQKENDLEFKTLPIDDHSHLVFNHGRHIYRFIFSSKQKRDECVLHIPKELIEEYQYIIEQEDGLTYYLFMERYNQ